MASLWLRRGYWIVQENHRFYTGNQIVGLGQIYGEKKACLGCLRVQSGVFMDQGDNELSKLMRLLDFVVKEAGLTYTQLEDRLGWSSGSLSRLLSGGRELKLRQLLEILRAVGMRPSRFFVISEEQRPIERTLSLRAIILNSILEEGSIPQVEAMLPDDQLEVRIERVVRRLLASRDLS